MPFSAATGVAEAALATGTTTSDQTQATSMQAPVNVPKMMSVRLSVRSGRIFLGRIFNSPLETSKDMQIFSPFQRRRAAANRC
jgi:hypothetical protein